MNIRIFLPRYMSHIPLSISWLSFIPSNFFSRRVKYLTCIGVICIFPYLINLPFIVTRSAVILRTDFSQMKMSKYNIYLDSYFVSTCIFSAQKNSPLSRIFTVFFLFFLVFIGRCYLSALMEIFAPLKSPAKDILMDGFFCLVERV